jgi:LPXTG-motif cell wall-anchored protein
MLNHPTASRLATRLVAALLIAGTSTVPVHSAAAVAPPMELALPLDEPMTGAALSAPDSWIVQGTANLTNAPVGDGWMELTPASGGVGAAVLNAPFSTASGVVVEFDYSVTNGTPDPGDGFSFYLLDGSTASPTTGAGGGGLGYLGTGIINGVPNGYVGIGFDEYGNYNNDGGGRRRGIGIRGSGNGVTGYNLVAVKTEAELGFTILHGATDTRRARIRVLNGVMTVMVKVNGVWKTSFRKLDLASLPGQAAMPSTFKMGFAASTGGSRARHQIRNVHIAAAGLNATSTAIKHLELDTDHDDAAYPVELVTEATYENNEGSVPDAVVKQPVLDNLESVSPEWTCTATSPAACPAGGTGDATGISLTAGSGEAHVSRMISSDANSDTVDTEITSVSNPNDWWIESLVLSFPVASAPEMVATVAEDGAAIMVPVALDDPEGDDVTITAASAAHGTATVTTAGELSYTPNPDFNGADTVSFAITDGTNSVTGNTVAVNVTAVNDAPLLSGSATPGSMSLTVLAGASGTVAIDDVTDVDSGTFTVTITSAPSHGTATVQSASALVTAASLDAGSAIVYQPVPGFSGADSFTYTVSDGNGGSVSRIVNVDVRAQLPATGSSSKGVVEIAALALLMGLVLVGINRRRVRMRADIIST